MKKFLIRLIIFALVVLSCFFAYKKYEKQIDEFFGFDRLFEKSATLYAAETGTYETVYEGNKEVVSWGSYTLSPTINITSIYPAGTTGKTIRLTFNYQYDDGYGYQFGNSQAAIILNDNNTFTNIDSCAVKLNGNILTFTVYGDFSYWCNLNILKVEIYNEPVFKDSYIENGIQYAIENTTSYDTTVFALALLSDNTDLLSRYLDNDILEYAYFENYTFVSGSGQSSTKSGKIKADFKCGFRFDNGDFYELTAAVTMMRYYTTDSNIPSEQMAELKDVDINNFEFTKTSNTTVIQGLGEIVYPIEFEITDVTVSIQESFKYAFGDLILLPFENSFTITHSVSYKNDIYLTFSAKVVGPKLIKYNIVTKQFDVVDVFINETDSISDMLLVGSNIYILYDDKFFVYEIENNYMYELSNPFGTAYNWVFLQQYDNKIYISKNLSQVFYFDTLTKTYSDVISVLNESPYSSVLTSVIVDDYMYLGMENGLFKKLNLLTNKVENINNTTSIVTFNKLINMGNYIYCFASLNSIAVFNLISNSFIQLVSPYKYDNNYIDAIKLNDNQIACFAENSMTNYEQCFILNVVDNSFVAATAPYFINNTYVRHIAAEVINNKLYAAGVNKRFAIMDLSEEELPKYNVKYVDYDGSIIEQFEVEEGLFYPKTSIIPNRTGYRFLGYSNIEYFDLRVDSNLIFTAIYEEITSFKVNYRDYNGNIIESFDVYEGFNCPAYTITPVREGSRFIGYTNSELIGQPVTNDLNFYAQYIEQFVITFLNPDGTEFKKYNVDKNLEFDLSIVPIPQYDSTYYFVGWNDNYVGETVTSNRIYTAIIETLIKVDIQKTSTGKIDFSSDNYAYRNDFVYYIQVENVGTSAKPKYETLLYFASTITGKSEKYVKLRDGQYEGKVVTVDNMLYVFFYDKVFKVASSASVIELPTNLLSLGLTVTKISNAKTLTSNLILTEITFLFSGDLVVRYAVFNIALNSFTVIYYDFYNSNDIAELMVLYENENIYIFQKLNKINLATPSGTTYSRFKEFQYFYKYNITTKSVEQILLPFTAVKVHDHIEGKYNSDAIMSVYIENQTLFYGTYNGHFCVYNIAAYELISKQSNAFNGSSSQSIFKIDDKLFLTYSIDNTFIFNKSGLFIYDYNAKLLLPTQYQNLEFLKFKNVFKNTNDLKYFVFIDADFYSINFSQVEISLSSYLPVFTLEDNVLTLTNYPIGYEKLNFVLRHNDKKLCDITFSEENLSINLVLTIGKAAGYFSVFDLSALLVNKELQYSLQVVDDVSGKSLISSPIMYNYRQSCIDLGFNSMEYVGDDMVIFLEILLPYIADLFTGSIEFTMNGIVCIAEFSKGVLIALYEMVADLIDELLIEPLTKLQEFVKKIFQPFIDFFGLTYKVLKIILIGLVAIIGYLLLRIINFLIIQPIVKPLLDKTKKRKPKSKGYSRGNY